MNKNEAIEKINKLFNLANNSGATEGEKQNALEMANKLAKKYNIGVEKKREYEYICYEFKKYDKKFVFHILISLGYYFSLDDNFFYVRNDIPFNFEAFKTFYKATIKVYEVHLRYMKTNNANGTKVTALNSREAGLLALQQHFVELNESIRRNILILVTMLFFPSVNMLKLLLL